MIGCEKTKGVGYVMGIRRYRRVRHMHSIQTREVGVEVVYKDRGGE